MPTSELFNEVYMLLGVHGFHARYVHSEARHRIAEIVRTLAGMVRSCEGCKHNLGGGCCARGLESECREGGGFEAREGAVI